MSEPVRGNSCGDCASCGCGSCGGCGRQVVLTPQEVGLLREFAVYAFLPYGARTGGGAPLFRAEDGTEYSAELLSLRRKGLIRMDDDICLAGFDYAVYPEHPVHGSAALTLTGQETLDALDRQMPEGAADLSARRDADDGAV